MSPTQRIGTLLTALLLLLLVGWRGLAAVYQAPGAVTYGHNPGELTESLSPQIPIAEATAGQHVIFMGMHIERIYELSLQSRTFTADGYVWIEWSRRTQQFMEAQGLRASELIHLVNQIERWDSSFEPETEEPAILSAGRRYQRFRFSSRFHDDQINFERDPFDILILPIMVEIAPDVLSDKYAQALLYPHQQQDGLLGESGSLSGYRLQGASLQALLHRYPSRFGSWYQPTKSLVRLEIQYRADYWSAFVRWVLPILVIMSIVILTPTVVGSHSDIRLAVPTTALLALVFMHQAYRSDLPPLPYLTLLDVMFSWGYLTCVGLFALFTWGTNVYASAPEHKKLAAATQIDRVDVVFQVVSLGTFLVLMLVLWWSTGS